MRAFALIVVTLLLAVGCQPGAVGVLNAMDQVGSLAATVIIVLVLLSGLAFFRAARVR